MNSWQRFLRTHRPVCVVYEMGRWLGHKILGLGRQQTPVWYGFDQKPLPTARETLPISPAWYRICRPLYRRENIYYNLDNALAVNPNIKGIALVFFMGIGDYLYTTPMLEALKQKYPQLPFYGYVGAQVDRNNSPVVGKLLEQNPCIEKVFYFQGMRHPFIWKNYDYSDALRQIPDGFLVMPVYYDYNVQVSHRVYSLFETFGLPQPAQLPAPNLYFPSVAAPAVGAYLSEISNKATGKKGIVFLQLDSRSSNYTYPYVHSLAEQFITLGYLVLSVTKGGPLENPNYVEIDIKRLSINDTWHLLSQLKPNFSIYIISVISVFWAASAGLGLPNLGLHHWIDPKVHNVWYPNIEVVTHHLYPKLPRERQILAPKESYTRHNHKMVDYKPDWVVKWFQEKIEK